MTKKRSGVKQKITEEMQERVIRDSFTMLPKDQKLIVSLKERCLKNATYATKSQLLRAGLSALNEMSDKELLAAITRLDKPKVGRPLVKQKA
jgi:uncharacterized protein HemY